MRKKSPLALLPLLLALGGCASWTSTPYEAPVLDLPARWTPPALPAGVETTANWWQAFNDPALNTLVDEVLARNNDLAVAGLRLQQARLQAGLAFSNQLPSVSVRQTGNASRQLGQGDSVTHAYGLTGGLSYEVDLWGKLSRQHDASQWEAEATAADLAGTRLTLIGSTATLYWQLGYLNQRLTLAQANTAYTAETLKLVEAQYRAGAASRLEVLSASQSLESQKASETDLMQQREEARQEMAAQQPAAVTVDKERSAADARKELTAMGLQYFNQEQFVSAILRGDALAVDLFITGAGVDINAPAQGTTPLAAAESGERQEIIALLKNAGAH